MSSTKKKEPELTRKNLDNKPQWFKPLRRRIITKQLASVDTEDDGKGEIHSLRIIGFYHNDRYFHFKNRYDFIDFLFNYPIKGKLYVGATNLEYDIINLFKSYWDRVELFYGNHLIYAKLHNKKIYFFDTLNHYKASVKKMGDVIGLEKFEENVGDIDSIPFDRLMKYNERDCEIVYRFMIEYQKRLNDIGAEMNFTIASSALNLYRRKFMRGKILRPPDETLDMWRGGYYGGRTEIFTMSCEATEDNPVRYLDVNSLYPDVMKANQYPVPDSFVPCRQIKEFGIYDCDIEVFDTYLPYLPKRWNGKLVFPVGMLKGIWTGYELKFAEENNLIKIHKIREGYKFTAHEDYFSQYVDRLYNMRKEAISSNDKFMDISLKLLMNSLYGKFGERVESKLAMSENGELTEIVLDEVYYPKHTNYILSIYVTAYARTLLYKGLKNVVDNKGCLLYCDTDSILYKKKTKDTRDDLKISDELGDYKLVGTFKKVEFYQPKAYKLTKFNGEEVIKVKGIKKEYARQFLEDGYATYKKPIRLRESIKRIDKMNYSANKWVNITKVLKSGYDKRVKMNNSFGTRPLMLKEF